LYRYLGNCILKKDIFKHKHYITKNNYKSENKI